jgi:2-dehydropantoate 2-reductase
MSLRVLVLGAGAVGGFFGGRLMEAGAKVSFLVREKRKAQLGEQGLRIESPFGNSLHQVDAKLQRELDASYDIVLLTCKAYDLDAAIESIRPIVSSSAAVLPLLNGLAHIERLNKAFGRDSVVPGTVKIQVTLASPGVVRQLNDWQSISFGEQNGEVTARVTELRSLLAAKGIAATISPDIMRDLWWKIVHLSTVAGMTCLMRANLGEIVRTPEGSALLTGFLKTNAAIAEHAGYAPDEAFLNTYAELFRQRDSTYEASMLRDLEKGGLIEADHILGFMLRKCREAGLPDTLHLAAYTHAKAYEMRREAGRLP